MDPLSWFELANTSETPTEHRQDWALGFRGVGAGEIECISPQVSPKRVTGFVPIFRNKFPGLFQDFSRTQIDFSRTIKFTLTLSLPRSQC